MTTPLEVGLAIVAYYAKPGNEVGGNCHTVLDDQNVEDEFVEACLLRCEEAGDTDGVEIMRAFIPMWEGERELVLEITRALANSEVRGAKLERERIISLLERWAAKAAAFGKSDLLQGHIVALLRNLAQELRGGG